MAGLREGWMKARRREPEPVGSRSGRCVAHVVGRLSAAVLRRDRAVCGHVSLAGLALAASTPPATVIDDDASFSVPQVNQYHEAHSENPTTRAWALGDDLAVAADQLGQDP